jgi:alpha-L-rhamnosidase
MNQITGNEAEAKQYTLLVEQIREKIIKKFVKKNAKIERETQAGYALAVDWKLFGPESYDKVWNNLKKAFKRYKGRLSTGFFSTRSLLNTLRILGQADLAYQLIHSTQFPSWGYSIEQGATTIWERWDGYVKGRGFQSRGMNSFNHYAYGSVVEFFYTTIFGINPDPENPGYANIIFEPVFDPTLSSVEGSYHSIRGLIKVKWEKFNLENQKTKYRYNFSIPPNTTGTLKLKLLNGKIELWDSRNRNIHVNEGQKEVKLKTGSYLMEFTK